MSIYKNPPIIFCHYGNNFYLNTSTYLASISNNKTTKIFLGDHSNKYIAQKHNWEFYFFKDLDCDLEKKFTNTFQNIYKGNKPIKGGRNWLEFVFLRWFKVYAYCKNNNINYFWHFDSDVIILKDLSSFAKEIVGNYKYTKLCHGSCLGGLVSIEILEKYLDFICNFFSNNCLLSESKRFIEKSPNGYTINEMYVFQKAEEEGILRNGINLSRYFADMHFDSALCHSEGFETLKYNLFFRNNLKNISYDGQDFFGKIKGRRVNFVILNLSWLPPYFSNFIMKTFVQNKPKKINTFLLNLSWIRQKFLSLIRIIMDRKQ